MPAPKLALQSQAVPWAGALARLALSWVAIFALFWSDWVNMARQWWDISTYNHALLIPVIVAWLVWQRWPQVQRLAPVAWWPGWIVLTGATFVWLLGAISGLDLARQAGVVAMLAACVPLMLGVKVTAGVLFPLCYLVFLIPFGEELVKVLQMVTAAITIGLTHLSGIDAVIDGVFIHTPAGLFEVAEACSGVKFLIAMIAFGVLAGNVCFISWPRRVAMLCACIIVPIVANGIRAWGTIYAAQFVGAEAASGFDHIIYGWVFFAVVLAAVMACAWRFFDRPIHAPMINPQRIASQPWLTRLEGLRIGNGLALGGFAVVIVSMMAWAHAAENLRAPMPSTIALPEVSGWYRVDYTPKIWWEPAAQGADHRLLGSYADDKGHRIDVFVALYASQGEGREAGGYGQGALMRSSPWAWQAPGPAFPEGVSERLLGHGEVERVAVTWYRTGTLFSGSNVRLKAAVMRDHLLLQARPTTMLILSAEDHPKGTAQASIAAFRQSAGPLDTWLDRLTQIR